jgi:hypothetical protein
MPELSGPRAKFGEKPKGVSYVHECVEHLQDKHEANVSGKPPQGYRRASESKQSL